MRISRNFVVADWKCISFLEEAHWQRGTEIFLDRIHTRYLEHIRVLLTHQTNGFVVLALDSALIETLEQFRRGKSRTPRGKGAEYFGAFLTQTAFGKHFTPDLARIFYKEIRCGLLHQSEAGGSSRVKRGASLPLVSPTANGKGVVINAPDFHNLLEVVIDTYADEIRAGTNVEQRAAFRKKMNFICRIEKEGPLESDA